jgi:hypothetical protein
MGLIAHSGKKYRVCQHLIGVRSRVVGFFLRPVAQRQFRLAIVVLNQKPISVWSKGAAMHSLDTPDTP